MRYECTLTLVPSFTRTRSGRDQFLVASKELLEVLSEHYEQNTQSASFIAELHQSNDVHFHGIIELRDHKERDRFINRLRRRRIFGRRTITQLINYPAYCEYMNKSVRITRDIIGDPIVRDDFGVYADPQYRFLTSGQDESNGMVDPSLGPGTFDAKREAHADSHPT